LSTASASAVLAEKTAAVIEELELGAALGDEVHAGRDVRHHLVGVV
jgi:hypothetical protein